MIWKECSATFAGASPSRMIAILSLAAAAMAGIGYWVYVMGVPAFVEMTTYGYGHTSPSSDRSALNATVRVLTVILYVFGGMLLAASAATGVTIEREKDTWTSLTSTPLGSGEIILAKILGTFWRVRGLLATLLFVWLVGLCCGAVHPLGFLAALAVASAALTFTAVLGTYFSLRSKSSGRAIAATLVTLGFLNGGYLICCFPVMSGHESLILTAGCSPAIVPFALLSFSELQDILYGPGSGLILFTGFLCLALYGPLTLGLFYLCLSRFELEVDRPRREFPGYSGRGNARGAVLDDEDDTLFAVNDRLAKKQIEQPLEPEIAEQPDPCTDPASHRREFSGEDLENV
ncbi:MAG: ABC transporter permease [Planctomycetaceae bacterium]|nr:ABC transporter permease [Planctomycetaceae bacterium]